MTDTTGMADDATETADPTRRADEATEMTDGSGMANDTIELSELLEYLAEGLVDDPEQVSVERFDEQDGTIVLELAVGPDDYGKVIGRGGRTAQALRTIVKAAAAHEGRRVLVDIVD
jgi:predicted RNA-binding protein YlqC (UPF0109 family)